ncbi:MAG: Integral rane protein [Labilithrix sp.]|nr:Integral rane protein [Labilithrix sp.]
MARRLIDDASCATHSLDAMYASLGAFIHRRPRLVLLASVLFLAASLLLVVRGGRLAGASIGGLEANRAQSLVDAITLRRDDATVAVVFQSADLAPTDPDFTREMERAVAPLRSDPRVASVTTPEDAPGPMIDRLRSREARTALALVTLRGNVEESLAEWPELRAKLKSDRLTIACTGKIPFLADLAAILEHDLVRAELLSIPLALLVLLLVFRTVTAATLPVGVGGLAVVGGIGLVLALSHVVEVGQYTINVCSLIGFGVAIDYSLFIVSRYREEIAAGQSYRDALVRAMDTAGRAVAFSGLAVATGLMGLLFFRGSYLAVMGVGGAIVVALAVIFALTLLPALLALLGPRIDAGKLPGVSTVRPSGGFWRAVAVAVMRRPVTILVPTLLGLLVVALPATHMRVAASDARMLPPGTEARRGYEILERAFPDLAASRVIVAVRFPGPVLTPSRVGALWELSHRIAALPHVVRVESVVDPPRAHPDDELPDEEELTRALTSPTDLERPLVEQGTKLVVKDDTTVLYALSDAPPDSAEAEQLVNAIRRQRTVGDGTLEVGGQAAYDVDATHFLLSRMPYAFGFVVGATFLVVLVLLRSVLLPFKAVFMNALSISASFGALVWIFQDAHLFVHERHPLDPSLPVLLFCISFGLSMDYEVLMLVRMKEIYERTGDNETAVAEGLERTAGLITSAAAIMVSVFLAFALARIVVLQATGVGMALAIALDATLVRALLVPATMRLLGHLNWWAPSWMRAAPPGAPRPAE